MYEVTELEKLLRNECSGARKILEKEVMTSERVKEMTEVTLKHTKNKCS